MAAPAAEQALRRVGQQLAARSPSVQLVLRVAALDARSLDGADVVVAASADQLAGVGSRITGPRVSFDCEDEVLLVGSAGTVTAELAAALERAPRILLADPRGEGAAAEAALARAGLRRTVADKLGYLGTAQAVLATVRDGTAVGLVRRSDLAQAKGALAVIASGFDGARACSTAALLGDAPHADHGRVVLSLLAQSTGRAETGAPSLKE